MPFPMELQDDSFFKRGMIVQDRHASTRLVRRRAAWTVGCWVAKVTPEMRPTCYKLLISMMEEQDMCVQLSAVNGMRALVEDWGFCEGYARFHVKRRYVFVTVLALYGLSYESSEMQVCSIYNTIGGYPLGEGCMCLYGSDSQMSAVSQFFQPASMSVFVSGRTCNGLATRVSRTQISACPSLEYATCQKTNFCNSGSASPFALEFS